MWFPYLVVIKFRGIIQLSHVYAKGCLLSNKLIISMNCVNFTTMHLELIWRLNFSVLEVLCDYWKLDKKNVVQLKLCLVHISSVGIHLL